MKHKTKLIIVVAVSLVVITGILVYISLNLNKKNASLSEVQNQEPSVANEVKTEQQSQDEISAKNKTYQELQPDMKTVAIPGEVTFLDANLIELSNGGVKNTFILKDTVLVISMKDGGEKKAISDIKKGDTVSVVLNAANSEVVGIQIENTK